MIARKVYDDLPEGCRQYIRAVARVNRDGGVSPLDVLLMNLVEHGLLVARARPGRGGNHPDDYIFRRAPELRDTEFTDGFEQLGHLLDEDAS